MSNVINYITVPSKEIKDLKRSKRLFFFMVISLIILSIYTAPKAFKFFFIAAEHNTIKIDNRLAELLSGLTISLMAAELIFLASVIGILIIQLIILKIGIDKEIALLINLASMPIVLITGISLIISGTISGVIYRIVYDNWDIIKRAFADEFDVKNAYEILKGTAAGSLIPIALVSTALTVYFLVIYLTAICATVESFIKMPRKAVYSGKYNGLVIENASHENSADAGMIYNNIPRTSWEERTREGTVIKEWIYFIESIDYRNQIRVIREGPIVLGLILISKDFKKIESVSIDRDTKDELPVKALLVQDFVRSLKKSKRPVTEIKVNQTDAKLKHILSNTGWLLDEKSSTSSKACFKFNERKMYSDLR